MVYRGMVRFYLMFFLSFMLIAVLPCQGTEAGADGDRRELVWAASDGLRHEIYSSTYGEKEWTEPVKITDNNADNLHPVIDIAADGVKWLFWSAVRPNGISIEYAYFTSAAGWSDPVKLPWEQYSAITPSILVEPTGQVWLVWAGNDGGNDEIFYSRYTDTVWSEPQLVHTANKVPDIKPEIAYNKQGKIEISWLGFRDNQYKQLYSVYTDARGWSPEEEKKEVESEEVNAAEPLADLPSFLPANSQYFLKLY